MSVLIFWLMVQISVVLSFSPHTRRVFALTMSMQKRDLPSPIIIGGGPTGLSCAITLARRGYTDIKVFDRLEEPPAPESDIWASGDRSYNIGISGRGQKFLKHIEVMDRLNKYSCDVVGRLDWNPGTAVDDPREIIYTTKNYKTKCLQRDRLAGLLLQECREKYNSQITIYHDVECTDVSWTEEKKTELCHLSLHNMGNGNVEKISSSFVIGCDGATSALRTAMQQTSPKSKFDVKLYEDTNIRYYKTIPLHFPKDKASKKKWRTDLNYSARTASDINIDALPTKDGPYVGVVLYRPWDERVANIMTGTDAKNFFEDTLPMFAPMIRDEDYAHFAAKGDNKLPKFMFAGPYLHKGKSTVLLGDAIHTVKPYFGLGVNTAFEDVYALDESLDKYHDNVAKSIAHFSSKRGKEAKAMVQISRRLDGGFLTFVLPLIVDNILHKAAPHIFSPNTLTSLQNEKKTFTQVRVRKRIDRLLQSILTVSAISALYKLSRATFRVAKMLIH